MHHRSQLIPRNHSIPGLLAVALCTTLNGFAQTNAPAGPAPLQLPVYRVEAEAETDHYIQGPFLPDVQGTKINVRRFVPSSEGRPV